MGHHRDLLGPGSDAPLHCWTGFGTTTSIKSAHWPEATGRCQRESTLTDNVPSYWSSILYPCCCPPNAPSVDGWCTIAHTLQWDFWVMTKQIWEGLDCTVKVLCNNITHSYTPNGFRSSSVICINNFWPLGNILRLGLLNVIQHQSKLCNLAAAFSCTWNCVKQFFGCSDTYFSYVMQMTRTTKFVYKGNSRGNK